MIIAALPADRQKLVFLKRFIFCELVNISWHLYFCNILQRFCDVRSQYVLFCVIFFSTPRTGTDAHIPATLFEASWLKHALIMCRKLSTAWGPWSHVLINHCTDHKYILFLSGNYRQSLSLFLHGEKKICKWSPYEATMDVEIWKIGRKKLEKVMIYSMSFNVYDVTLANRRNNEILFF